MKNKLVRLASQLTTAAMVVSMFASVTPASAAITVVKDTMSRLNASVTSSHSISFVSDVAVTGNSARNMTLALGGIADFTGEGGVIPGDVTMTIAAAPITEVAVCTPVAGEVAITQTAPPGTGLTFTFCTGTNVAISDVITIDIADGKITNPAAGTYQLLIGGTGLIAGTAQLAIMDFDYVTVTATIQSTMVFDIDIAAACGAETGGAYAVSLSNLTTGSVTTAANHICLDLKTNGTGGAIVEVMNDTANGLDGQNTADFIVTPWANAAATLLTAGVEGYGLCAVGSVVTGAITPVQPYNGACATDVVGGVASTFKTLANTGGAPVDGTNNGAIDLKVRASIAPTTMADSYRSILTFRATGTF